MHATKPVTMNDVQRRKMRLHARTGREGPTHTVSASVNVGYLEPFFFLPPPTFFRRFLASLTTGLFGYLVITSS